MIDPSDLQASRGRVGPARVWPASSSAWHPCLSSSPARAGASRTRNWDWASECLRGLKGVGKGLLKSLLSASGPISGHPGWAPPSCLRRRPSLACGARAWSRGFRSGRRPCRTTPDLQPADRAQRLDRAMGGRPMCTAALYRSGEGWTWWTPPVGFSSVARLESCVCSPPTALQQGLSAATRRPAAGAVRGMSQVIRAPFIACSRRVSWRADAQRYAWPGEEERGRRRAAVRQDGGKPHCMFRTASHRSSEGVPSSRESGSVQAGIRVCRIPRPGVVRHVRSQRASLQRGEGNTEGSDAIGPERPLRSANGHALSRCRARHATPVAAQGCDCGGLRRPRPAYSGSKAGFALRKKARRDELRRHLALAARRVEQDGPLAWARRLE